MITEEQGLKVREHEHDLLKLVTLAEAHLSNQNPSAISNLELLDSSGSNKNLSVTIARKAIQLFQTVDEKVLSWEDHCLDLFMGLGDILKVALQAELTYKDEPGKAVIVQEMQQFAQPFYDCIIEALGAGGIDVILRMTAHKYALRYLQVYSDNLISVYDQLESTSSAGTKTIEQVALTKCNYNPEAEHRVLKNMLLKDFYIDKVLYEGILPGIESLKEDNTFVSSYIDKFAE